MFGAFSQSSFDFLAFFLFHSMDAAQKVTACSTGQKYSKFSETSRKNSPIFFQFSHNLESPTLVAAQAYY